MQRYGNRFIVRPFRQCDIMRVLFWYRSAGTCIGQNLQTILMAWRHLRRPGCRRGQRGFLRRSLEGDFSLVHDCHLGTKFLNVIDNVGRNNIKETLPAYKSQLIKESGTRLLDCSIIFNANILLRLSVNRPRAANVV